MATGIGPWMTSLAALALDSTVRDDSLTDQLNHVIMYRLLVSLAVVTGMKQLVGVPIACWLPAQYKEKFQKNFANNYCWTNSLYYLTEAEDMQVQSGRGYEHANEVTFYRWIILLFLALAVLHRVPHLLWGELRHLSGINAQKLIGMTTDTALMGQGDRDRQLGHVAEFFHRWVTTHHGRQLHGYSQFLRQVTNSCCGKRSGHTLVTIYLLIKLLYLLNTVLQFVIISSVLRVNFWEFAPKVVDSLLHPGGWDIEEVFPRVALCDMRIRQLGNIQTYTLQCVLPANLFLEKMFLMLWFCLLILLTANVISLFWWALKLVSDVEAKQFLMKFSDQLVLESAATQKDHQLHITNVARYLRKDGMFVLRMISSNTSDMFTVDLLRAILIRYQKFCSQKSQMNIRLDSAINSK